MVSKLTQSIDVKIKAQKTSSDVMKVIGKSTPEEKKRVDFSQETKELFKGGKR